MKTMTDTAVLTPLFDYLDSLEGPAEVEQLRAILGALKLSRQALGEHVQFSDDDYKRNLMGQGEWYQVFCICWRNGQRSTVHDHAQCVCGVRIVEGTCTETVYRPCGRGQVVATGSAELHEGQVCVSVCSDTHQISNLADDDGELITLHIYSPPLREFRSFDTVNGTITIMRDDGNGCCKPARTYRCGEEGKTA